MSEKLRKLWSSAALFSFFALNSLQKSEARSEISGDVLSFLPPPPLPPPPLPPTSHTSCTSWGRAMWREGGRAGWREKREKKNKSRAIISLKWACRGVRNRGEKEKRWIRHVAGLENKISRLRVRNRKWQVTLLQRRSALNKVQDLHFFFVFCLFSHPGGEEPERNGKDALWLDYKH